MPTDACQCFYECEQCHAVLRPKPGDCYVCCSYGTGGAVSFASRVFCSSSAAGASTKVS